MRQGYTRIPNALISDETLSFAAKTMYIYIASQAKDWVFYPDIMGKDLNIGRDKRRQLLHELEQHGLLEIQRIGGSRGKRYRVTIKDGFSGDNKGIKDGNSGAENGVKDGFSGDDHLINNKNSVCDKNCARAREAHTQDSNSSAAPTDPNAALMKVFIDGTKKASDELHCPREMTVAFHEYWTATVADGRPLWATKQAFNFKQRLKTWMRHEQR